MPTSEFGSFWARNAKGSPYPELVGTHHCVTMVVGAGIVGLTAALRLAEAGREVMVVEALTVGRQVTGGSTAKITLQHGLIYSALITLLGHDKAAFYLEANRAGIDRIVRWIDEFDIPCEFERRPAFLYSEAAETVAALEAEAEAAQSLGLPMTLLDSAPLPFRTTGAVRLDDQAQFNPVKYLDALAEAVVARGGFIFEHSRVRLVDEVSRWRVVTDKGNVHAENVVVATNLPIKSPVGMAGRTRPRMHTAMAVPIETEAISGMFLGIDEPAHSLRTAQTSSGPVLIALGPKFDTGHERDVTRHFHDLEVWINRNLTAASPIASWCNEDYDTEDRVPFVGQPDPEKSPGFYVATGFNAWGISNGTAGGMLIADSIRGEPHDWAQLYDPARPTSKTFNKGGDTASLVSAIANIAPGEGGVVEREGTKLAVFRDETGRLTELKAECTHKGCIVTWNNAAKTWDCPCHGSIFSAKGNVLHGPARKDLERTSEE